MKKSFFAVMVLFFAPAISSAMQINEIMYDPAGTDDKHEWVEVFNDSGAETDMTGWKFNDGSNHTLNIPPQNGGQGSIIIPASGYAILASDATTFLSDHPGFTGNVIDTVISGLGQQADKTYTISLTNGTEPIDTASYTILLGAKDDGNSLQKNGSSWISASPTPGVLNSTTPAEPQNSGDTATTTEETASSSSSSGSSVSSAHSSPAPLSDDKPKLEFEISAGRDRLGSTGSKLSFKAYITRADRMDTRGVSFTWSFGDGTTATGDTVSHAYAFPGKYALVLNGSYSDRQAVSRAIVTIISPAVVILPVPGGVELWNKSAEEINLEGWVLASGVRTFSFPADTLLSSHEKIVFGNNITGLSDGDISREVSLKNPFGNIFAEYISKDLIPAGQISNIAIATSTSVLEEQLASAEKQLAELYIEADTSPTNVEPSSRTKALTVSYSSKDGKEDPSGEKVKASSSTQTASVISVFEAPKRSGFASALLSWPVKGFNFIRRLFVEE